MNAILKAYKSKYSKEPDEIEIPSKELAEAWLDDKIAVQEKVNKIYVDHDVDLVWGELDDGEYQNTVMVCNQLTVWMAEKKLQVYKGIENLAHVLGVRLHEENASESANYKYEYYFRYKGYRIFQISSEQIREVDT